MGQRAIPVTRSSGRCLPYWHMNPRYQPSRQLNPWLSLTTLRLSLLRSFCQRNLVGSVLLFTFYYTRQENLDTRTLATSSPAVTPSCAASSASTHIGWVMKQKCTCSNQSWAGMVRPYFRTVHVSGLPCLFLFVGHAHSNIVGGLMCSRVFLVPSLEFTAKRQ